MTQPLSNLPACSSLQVDRDGLEPEQLVRAGGQRAEWSDPGGGDRPAERQGDL